MNGLLMLNCELTVREKASILVENLYLQY